MAAKPTSARLEYRSRAHEAPSRRFAAAIYVRQHPIFVIGATLVVSLWVGSYLWVRARHSFGGIYASAPIEYKRLHYDEHYPWGTPLFYLHQPLAWLDDRITGTEVQRLKNDYLGDPDNYELERFN